MDNDQDDDLNKPVVGVGDDTDDNDDADEVDDLDTDEDEKLDEDGLPLEEVDPEADDDEEDE
jgi:hypothetical protein